jgi:hypothetical protein
MIKRLRIILVMLLLLIGYSKVVAPAIINDEAKAMYKTKAINFIFSLQYEKELDKFINQLGKDESNNDWLAINKIGAFGEWQFMDETLRVIGYGHITVNKFKADSSIFPPELQRKVLKTLIEVNAITLEDYIKHYEGLTIGGILITKAGILAGCHLGGPTSVKLFLLTNGTFNCRDIFKTSIKDYLIKYSCFDLILKEYNEVLDRNI